MIKKTFYKSWPQNVKNDFLTNINKNNDIFLSKLKKSFDNMTELEKGVYFQLENLIQNNSSNISGMKETCEDLQCKLVISSSEALITIPYSVFNLLKKK